MPLFPTALVPIFALALPPYLGGKRRLVSLFLAALAEVIPRTTWGQLRFLDPMCGGGAVALHAKACGFEVIASDIASRAVVPARALIENTHNRIRRSDVADLFRTPTGNFRHVAAEHSPQAIQPQAAAWIDSAVANALARPEPMRSLLLLVVIKLVLRQQPMSVLNATDATAAATDDFDRVSSRRLRHYLTARGLFTPEAVWNVAEQVNGGVFFGRGSAAQADALTAIATTHADIVYLDPPYARTTGYTEPYAVLDELLGDDLPHSAPPPSLDLLLQASAHIPTLLLSYGGPTTDLGQLRQTVEQYRTVRRAIEIPYPHLRSLAAKEKSRANREYFIVATA